MLLTIAIQYVVAFDDSFGSRISVHDLGLIRIPSIDEDKRFPL